MRCNAPSVNPSLVSLPRRAWKSLERETPYKDVKEHILDCTHSSSGFAHHNHTNNPLPVKMTVTETALNGLLDANKAWSTIFNRNHPGFLQNLAETAQRPKVSCAPNHLVSKHDTQIMFLINTVFVDWLRRLSRPRNFDHCQSAWRAFRS